MIDLRPWGLTGNAAESVLERVGITVNQNRIPYEKAKSRAISGIRVGSAACTSRGMQDGEFKEIGDMILAALGGVCSGTVNSRTVNSIHEGVAELTRRFPLPY